MSFTFVPPSFGSKNQLCTTNTISKWWRFAKTKIKNEFESHITEWYLPVWENNPYLYAEIEYTILRSDGKKIDSDSFAASAYKWMQDMLVRNGYLVDDDKTKITINPTQLHVEGEIETSVHVNITLKERFMMTIPELAVKATALDKELGIYFSDARTKAGSTRIRSILLDLKKATPQLRQDLADADKK